MVKGKITFSWTTFYKSQVQNSFAKRGKPAKVEMKFTTRHVQIQIKIVIKSIIYIIFFVKYVIFDFF